jgi:hypothetical protein
MIRQNILKLSSNTGIISPKNGIFSKNVIENATKISQMHFS